MRTTINQIKKGDYVILVKPKEGVKGIDTEDVGRIYYCVWTGTSLGKNFVKVTLNQPYEIIDGVGLFSWRFRKAKTHEIIAARLRGLLD